MEYKGLGIGSQLKEQLNQGNEILESLKLLGLRFSFLNARKQEIQIIEKRAMRTVEGKWREVAF